MSTEVWPPIPEDQLAIEVQQTLEREILWLLESLQETLQSLKAGLEECASLLAPADQPSILPLSSHRSESLKGIVTREGTRIVKGDIKLRLATLPSPKGATGYPLTISLLPHAPTLVLDQLIQARTLVNACLDVIDACSWAGKPDDANFVAGQLRLLDVNIIEAKNALKGGTEGPSAWFNSPVDENTFDPPLPPNVAVNAAIVDAALRFEVRVIEPAANSSNDHFSPFSFGNRFAAAISGSRPQAHDEMDQLFTYKGQDVKVKEKVRVDSADPMLMATFAKLTALERTLGIARKALDMLMGKDD